ncbi:NADH:flavin oxidoreductase/NADH oxidase [Acinetobacter pittii]|uniref:NADH:flavin oxidoreductase/NADH oxidase n=1 Tax=Acinetobacter pittii TaxID=48296 RepID=UPI002954E2E3|nr:NADH:flavin oxidoreductase/NADH oxidase [Acinetobacter pittii]MDV7708326.1 NADH:flavin oxidoreductase/NADH oxidase [Acinetobacter pittii]MDV7762695.1 NADH:flavin oxidoreductase/NADH oxidase [Acinetobacter pittii]
MTALFTPFQLKDVTLRNRIAVPPMCQYSAVEGKVTDWHLAHYTSIARGGAGLVIVEATGVSPEGRITPACLGLWSDEHIDGLAQIAQAIKAAGAVPGIQIAHAGRKASANSPWEGDDHIAADDPRGWQPIGASAVAYGENLPRVPQEMSIEDIQRVQADFVAAAGRAKQAGFEWLELHFAHGYLAQSFFSKHANFRQDQYGGDFEGRSRFILEAFSAVRSVWPENLPLTARFGVIEYDGHDEETLGESIELVKQLRANGLDLLNVSIGFNTPKAQVPWSESAFLAPVSERVRQEANLPVASSWGMDKPEVANRLVEQQQMDLVMIGRAFLADPHYPLQAAKALQLEKPTWVLPAPYAHWLERY